MVIVTPSELLRLLDYWETINALVEADDGTLIDGATLRVHERMKETIYDLAGRLESDPDDL